MGKYEEIVFNADEILLEKVLIWKRFIDDILMLFKGNEEECKLFVQFLNTLMPGVLKFQYEFSFQKIQFLDLEIFIEDGYLKTTLFVKPTNSQIYLDFDSNHPMHCKQSIPYSQALRVVERCDNIKDRDKHLETLKTKLEERNYPPDLIKKQLERAKGKERKEIIFQKRKKKLKKDGKIRLMMTQSTNNPPVHEWIRSCKRELMKNEKAKALGKQIQICTKQPKNLQRIAAGFKGELKKPNVSQDPGCRKCNHCKVACPVLQEGKIFSSTNTQKKYKIRQKLNCDSDWVIYLSTCKKCKGQYVGKSKTKFKVRHSNHKQEVKNKTGGLGHHYGGVGGYGYENMSVILIEQVEEKTLDFLAEREVFWQNQLRVYVQNGHKAHCYRKEKIRK